MTLSVPEQMRILLTMTLCGALLGAMYDGLCCVRYALHTGRLVREATDVLYGAVCAVVLIAAGLVLRVSVLRWVVPAGAALGLAAYRCGPGPVMRRVARRLSALGKSDKNPVNRPSAAGKR